MPQSEHPSPIQPAGHDDQWIRADKVSPEVMVMLLGAVVRQAAGNFVGTGQIGEPFLSVLYWLWREYWTSSAS
jgi:hypothetical protein